MAPLQPGSRAGEVLEVGWADNVRVFSKAEIYCGLQAALQVRFKPVMTVVLPCGWNGWGSDGGVCWTLL